MAPPCSDSKPGLHNYVISSWTELNGSPHCDIQPSGPYPVLFVEVICKRKRYANLNVAARTGVSAPANAAQLRIQGVPSDRWISPPVILARKPVTVSDVTIEHVHSGSENLQIRVKDTALGVVGNVVITVTLL